MLVSVIIPCFNSEHYIAECLESVLRQTYESIEVICIDDGSTDNSLEILNEFEKKYSDKMKVIKQENKGAPYARNKGLEIAKGEWIQFLDADDILLPDKIMNQVKLLMGKQVDIVIGNYILHKNQKKNKIKNEKREWVGLIKGQLGNTCSNLWRKQMIVEAGMWDNIKSSQETTLLFKMLKLNSNIVFDEHFETVIQNRNPNSISNSNNRENWFRYLNLRNEIWHYLEEKNKLTDDILSTLKINIFNTIRIIYTYDHKLGSEFYNQHVRGKFKPIISSGSSPMYLVLYYLFGFEFAQRVASLKKKSE